MARNRCASDEVVAALKAPEKAGVAGSPLIPSQDETAIQKDRQANNRQGDCHLLTFSCYDRRPIFDDDERRKLFSRAIDAAIVRLGFRLVAFVYMPEHVHLLVWAKDEGAKIENFLFAIKRPHSYRVKKLLEAADDPLLQKLTILERPGKMVFRFWQEGPGYDQNLEELDEVHRTDEYAHDNPVRRGLCEHPGD